jgi:hypothetical protein
MVLLKLIFYYFIQSKILELTFHGNSPLLPVSIDYKPKDSKDSYHTHTKGGLFRTFLLF